MDILTPSRIESLGSQSIRIIEHTASSKEEAPWNLKVYPFETILSIKQRITLHHEGERQWMPNQLFLAVKEEKGWNPIEFVWGFSNILTDPLDSAVKGKPDSRIMEGDVRKPIFPTVKSGITLENIQLGEKSEIHVWNLASLAEDLEVTDTIFAGYLQLYFPGLESTKQIDSALQNAPLTKEEKDTFEVIQQYQSIYDSRLSRIEELIPGLPQDSSELRQLQSLRIVLPVIPLKEGLEILFYEMTPTIHNPVLQYFPSQQRIQPLLKLATGPSGVPYITEQKLLKQLTSDQFDAESGSKIVMKAPIRHPKAPFGCTWSLYISEDGSAELVIGAPRKDTPVFAPVLQEAFRVLPNFLSITPWKNVQLQESRLKELSAFYEYRIKHDVRSKPSRNELRKRLDVMSSLFQEERVLTGDSAAISMRWKAVSNFREDTDPVMSYITNLYLKLGLASEESISIPMFLGALAREFGIGPNEGAEYLEKWSTSKAEYILTDPDAPEKAVAANSLGAAVSINNSHPKYIYHVAGVDSYKDLQRITTMLEVLISNSSEKLAPAGPEESEEMKELESKLEEVVAPIPEEVEVDPDQKMMWDQLMDFDMGDLEDLPDLNESENISEVQHVQPQPKPDVNDRAESEEMKERMLEIKKDPRYPKPISDLEEPLVLPSEFYLEQLRSHDNELFPTKDKDSDRLYSRGCQKNKQPNVMSPESYQMIRTLYGDSVRWIEAPLSDYDTNAIRVANTAPRERGKKDTKAVVAFEKRALQLGVPLDQDVSVLQFKDKDPTVYPLEDEEMKQLMEDQKKKPFWTVIRAGTISTKPNYYVCAEYWCVRDGLPLLTEDVKGTVSRSGAKKEANSCPFCTGRIIQNPKSPKKGETIYERSPVTAGGKVAKFGSFTKLIHPDKFAIPCCGTDYSKIIPPEGSLPLPPPLVELPELQRAVEVFKTERKVEKGEQKEDHGYHEDVDIDEEERAVKVQQSPLVDVFDNVKTKMEYIESKFLFLTADKKSKGRYKLLDKNKIEVKSKRILRTYIKESSYFPLEIGKVGILPEAVDAFLGQSRKDYIETTQYGDIYTHPAVQARAFFRLGLGVNTTNAGQMMLQLAAFSRYAVSQFVPSTSSKVLTPDELLVDMFVTNEILTFHAFQQANYGSLIHEFSNDHREIVEGEFQEWCGRMGIPLPAQRAYALQSYKAWLNFRNYVSDEYEAKDMRIWEGLFAVPGLFTPTGVLIARISTDTNDNVVLHCPRYGVSLRSQQVKPPVLFLYEDRKSRLCEPLILFSGPDMLLGVVEPESDLFGKLPSALRTPLSAFYSEYVGTEKGCGRIQSPSNPWMPEVNQTSVPRLGQVMDVLDKHNLSAHSLLRDRTHRLVGLIVHPKHTNQLHFIPVVDDGAVFVQLLSVYDTESLPLPTLESLLTVLTGPSESGGKKSLASDFPSLYPHQLRSSQITVGEELETMFVAVETVAGCFIPIKPQRVTSTVNHVVFTEMIERGYVNLDSMPWEEDVRILKGREMTKEEKEAIQTLDFNPEEVLQETYQHVRLTLSNWLQDTAEGRKVKQQIELLRKAKNRLPLFERRKRADLLLIPYIKQWIHVGDIQTEGTSLLRRNCLQIKKEGTCKGQCTWSDGRCLIHASATPRFVDPVFVITARIVDELLRTYGDAKQVLDNRVPRLRPPIGVVRGESSLIVATGDNVFQQIGLQGRLPSKYTQGYIYPEELGEEDVGFEKTEEGIPAAWTGLKRPVWHADLSRNLQSKHRAFWVAFLEQPLSVISSLIEPSLNVAELAKLANVDILVSSKAVVGYKIDEWYSSQTTPRRFLILDPAMNPLQTYSGNYAIPESKLPEAIRAWLDVGSPVKVGEVQRVPTPPAPAPVPVPVPVVAPIKEAPAPKQKKEKECPEGEILNPDTNRCIDVKGVKGKKLLKEKLAREAEEPEQPHMVLEEAPVVPAPPKPKKEKECPEGEILNPETGRCIDVKGVKGKKLLKEKLAR